MIIPATATSIQKAKKLLEAGHVVAFPTETVYGLGANAFDQAAVAKIFAIKSRPAINPLIVHIKDATRLTTVARIDEGSLCERRVNRLISLWPGPLSLVLPKQSTIPDNVTAGLNTVAVRIPAHPIALNLLSVIDFPLAAPSANLSSEVSPTSADHVWQSLGDRVELIIDGGSCLVGLESTVLAITNEVPTILRPGAITREQLEDALGEKVGILKTGAAAELCDKEIIHSSPGLLFKHYAPKTPITIRNTVSMEDLPEKVGLISFKPMPTDKTIPYERAIYLSEDENLDEIAKNLFATIRELDLLNLDLILIDVCREDGLGIAIMDRIRRACGLT